MAKIRFLSMFLCLCAISICAWSAGTITIGDVFDQYNQSTSQLDPEALRVIDDFWRISIDTMLLSDDTEKIVQLRLELQKYKGSNYLSFYASAYQKAAQEHIAVALETVKKLEDVTKKLRIERNLMILIAQLDRAGLSDLAIPELSNQDPMIRYWAVRSITSKEIVGQLKADVTRDEKRTAEIISALEGYLKSTSDTVTLPFIANFAEEMNTDASSKLLIMLADQRINAYMKWTVTDEVVDAEILKSLANLGMQVSDPADKQELLGRFGQLYACVIGRYMQSDKSPQVSREQLITVISEVEDKIISKQIPGWATKFRTNLNKNIALNDDYNLLFGSEGRIGELASKMNFNYGKDSSGKIIVSPRPLPPPPQSAAETTAPIPAVNP